MHDSLLALDRYFFGPATGGQGLQIKRHVGVQDDGKVALSYLSMGKAVFDRSNILHAKDAVISARDDGSTPDSIERLTDALKKFGPQSKFGISAMS